MIKSFLNKIFGNNIVDAPERSATINTNESIRSNENELIENCKKKVLERIEFYDQLKEIYDPTKDKLGSYTWSFMHSSQMVLRKVSLGYIEEYQIKFKISLPNLIVRVLTEVGSGGYVNTSLINSKNELGRPYVCMEKAFLDKCLEAEIDPDVIEYGIDEYYDFESNSFEHPEIQEVYASLNSDRDRYLAVLFGLNHPSSIVLNRNDNRTIVVSGVPGITNLSFKVNGREYDSPYFKYLEDTIEQAICPLNEGWWNKMKTDILKMNQEIR